MIGVKKDVLHRAKSKDVNNRLVLVKSRSDKLLGHRYRVPHAPSSSKPFRQHQLAATGITATDCGSVGSAGSGMFGGGGGGSGMFGGGAGGSSVMAGTERCLFSRTLRGAGVRCLGIDEGTPVRGLGGS